MVTNQEHLIPKGEPKDWTMKNLEDFGRIRLSCYFFMRDMLYSEVASRHGIMNVPDDPLLAVQVGTRLCRVLLDPLHMAFGHVSIRSAFRSVAVNEYGNKKYGNLAATHRNHARHVWDQLDHKEEKKGATTCIVIPWFVDYLERNPGTIVEGLGLVDSRSLALLRDEVFFQSEFQIFRIQSTLVRKTDSPYQGS